MVPPKNGFLSLRLPIFGASYLPFFYTRGMAPSRHPCFTDDDDDNDTFDMQNTHGQSRFTLADYPAMSFFFVC